jgi:long-chain acyl-CoA synthetase
LAVWPVRPKRDPPAGLAALDPAFIRFTSGTTGIAKGVVLSHDTIRERIDAANEALAIGSSDRVLWLLSMSYHFAVSIVSYLSFGATILLPAGGLAESMVRAADGQGATIIYGSPMQYGLLADFNGLSSLSRLRLAISTTMALDRVTAERFYHRYERPLTQALGIIELGLPCINTRFAIDRPDAVGCVLPAYELHFADAGLGTAGREILLRGKGMLDAYYEPWQTRSQILSRGWFHTGDVGYLDADGCLYISGRSKEVVNVMGVKFFPHEVEAVISSHPQVAAACVSAVPDDRFGELTVARVVPLEGASKDLTVGGLRAFCRARLAVAKIPHKFIFVDDLPRTASGKLRRLGAAFPR